MSTSKDSYHHGDLRQALIQAAVSMLEGGESFSLRAVARRAGVSATAPYRHFADREALESAVAVEGFRDLRAQLGEVAQAPGREDLVALATTYVFFALHHPTVFKLMFGQECDPSNDERVRAADELHSFIAAATARAFPEADAIDLSVALWSLAHGLAFLHLDGKLAADDDAAVAARVEAAFTAVLNLATTPRSTR